MSLSERPPSTAWEKLPLAGQPGRFVWAWFRPEGPQGLCLRIPDETWRDAARLPPTTMRMLLHAVGLDSRAVAFWSLQGAAYDGGRGSNPAWDYPIPEPGPGVDPTIH